jgi:hypothetical protein
MLGLEKLSTQELDKLHALYQELADQARSDTTGVDTGTPDVKAA